MTSAIARVDVWNMALDMLKEAPLSSTADDDDVARWFSRNYEQTRDALLAEHPWNFAVKAASLAANATAPTSRWLYGYALPSDLIRMLPLRKDGYFEGALITYEVNGQTIETNETAPLRVRYIYRNDTEGLWSPMFIEALSAKLAMKAGHWLTGKTSALQIAQSIYDDAVAKAKRIDGMEGTFERPYDDDVIGIRYAGGFRDDGNNQ